MYGVGVKRQVRRNLWSYVQDSETNPKDLVYTIVDQTNPDLVYCSIDDEKHLDCEVKENIDGVSRVTIQVDDFEFQERMGFEVKVSRFCQGHNTKGCIGNAAYWFDGCGIQQELIEACPQGKNCEDGECN